ncbi:Valine--tRNA ligase [Rhizoctonia solani]|uniref:Valine--tRNA ligase n=1 Tax=Rhizoctonia solani TaxID=456999 RepID=A0A0K6GCL1_9AGAM|nr:Valine--tRNA ligase [Rhizoctonia solani]
MTRPTCSARYPHETRCVRPAECESKWCSTHEEIEGKLLKLYKRHTSALEADVALHKDSFAARSVALKSGTTDAMVTLDALRSWYAEARNQALDTRIRHHNAFYHGGDAGHLQYLDFLRSLILELEGLMQKCDQLLLQKECAKWVQTSTIPAYNSVGCAVESSPGSSEHAGISGHGDRGPKPAPGNQTLPTPPPSPTSSRRRKNKSISSFEPAGCENTTCADETACKDSQKRNTTIQRLCVFLEPENGKLTNISYRAEVFATFFRRAIARSPSLFVRARTWEEEVTAEPISSHRSPTTGPSAKIIADFIRSTALTQNELERLVKKLPFVRGESMSAELIRGAIADTFRPPNAHHTLSGNSIPLLGGWVYEKPWSLPMSLQAWDALHELVACAGCALGVSRSFQEALMVRRFAFVGGCEEDACRLGVPIPRCLPARAVPRFPRWQDQCSSLEIAMRILNVWLAADNRKAKRCELKKFTPKTHGMKSSYSEHEERHWAYMRMRRSDERLVSFVDALNASPHFTILAQLNTKPEPTHIHVPSKPSDAWVSRVRSGTTPLARRSARWTTATIFRMEIFDYLHKRAPESKAGLTYSDETEILDLVVMDNLNGEWDSFLQRVGDTLLVACGYSSLDCMLAGELATAK